jgi:uncharacterized protein (DUF305 family)
MSTAVIHPASGVGLRNIAGRWSWGLLSMLLLLVGLAIGWLVRPATPGANSPEVRFSRDMAAHHAQAIDMALIMRDRTSDEQLRFFTLDIVLTQQAQIGQMQGWLAIWDQPLAGADPPMAGMAVMMGMATPEQVDRLRTLPLPDAEILFLQLMIRHHQGGVAMAEAVLRQTDRREVVRLASAIVSGQQTEIAVMEDALAKRGAAPLPPPQAAPHAPSDHP